MSRRFSINENRFNPHYMKTYEDTQFGVKIGEAVKKLRENRAMSQEDLREKAGFAKGYVSRLEAGEYASPSIHHVFSLAQALDMTLRDLLEQSNLIPERSSFESCLRGEGASDDQIKAIKEFKEYVLFTNKDSHTSEQSRPV